MKILFVALLTLTSISAFAGKSQWDCNLSKLNLELEPVDTITKTLELDGNHFGSSVEFSEFKEKYNISAEVGALDFTDGPEITSNISHGKYTASSENGFVKLSVGDESFSLSCN